jgi:hypothetical protein
MSEITDTAVRHAADCATAGVAGIHSANSLGERQRRNHRARPRSQRKRPVAEWILTAALAAMMLLSCQASHAAQKSIEWFDDFDCSYRIKFNPKQHDEQKLINTIDVIFTDKPFKFAGPNIPFDSETPANFSPEQFQNICESTIRRVTDLAVLDLPGIEAYRKLKLEEIDDECAFDQVKIQAASGNYPALRSYTPSAAKCSPFIDGLEGKADLMTLWRDMVNSQCQKNISPTTCRDSFFSNEKQPDGLDRIKRDVLIFGWNSCSTRYMKVNDNKRAEEMRMALTREFRLRFPITKGACPG